MHLGSVALGYKGSCNRVASFSRLSHAYLHDPQPCGQSFVGVRFEQPAGTARTAGIRALHLLEAIHLIDRRGRALNDRQLPREIRHLRRLRHPFRSRESAPRARVRDAQHHRRRGQDRALQARGAGTGESQCARDGCFAQEQGEGIVPRGRPADRKPRQGEGPWDGRTRPRSNVMVDVDLRRDESGFSL